ncbi:hypothetical protein CCE28_20425 [Anaeromicrobium sediminis]|uniref:Uncharacterized protein n=1 Tax=Anaeromicrobium sediminis TaxID=1478221 RepID=A0A267MB89_9FIRM|nr:hypothetical protein CCE28_20425 [Anaeromicrobium sediminis]
MKLVTVVSTFVILIPVMKVLIPQLPSEFFPYADKDILYIDIETELAGNMDATEKLTDKIAELIMKEPEITSCTVAVGNGLPKFYLTLPTATPSKDFG